MDACEAPPRYDEQAQLGRGCYGRVVRALDRETNRHVAVKQCRFDTIMGFDATSLREVAILRALSGASRSIVELLDVVVDERTRVVHIVMELGGEDLRTFMGRRAFIPPRVVQSLSRQLLDALFACHSRGVMHRDVKPDNVLVEPTDGLGFRLRLCDFGLSRKMGVAARAYTLEVVSRWYRSPELLLGWAQYGAEVDMWAFACVVGEMATMYPLFPAESDNEQLEVIFATLGTPPPSCDALTSLAAYRGHRATKQTYGAPSSWTANVMCQRYHAVPPACADVVQRALAYDPRQRLTAAEARRHVFFEENLA